MAGEDDHAAGDGREFLVSVPKAAFVEAGARELNGADVSLFFKSLPPGLGGMPKSACGQGSGSLIMAHMIEAALRKEVPMLLFDEDRAATNLLVPGCFQTGEVTPLSTLLACHREVFGDTAVIFAASSLDILIAQADRILVFDRHQAGSISRREFREKLIQYLREVEAGIRGESRSRR